MIWTLAIAYILGAAVTAGFLAGAMSVSRTDPEWRGLALAVALWPVVWIGIAGAFVGGIVNARRAA